MNAYFIIKLIDEYAGLAVFIIVALALCIHGIYSYIRDNRKFKYLIGLGFRRVKHCSSHTTCSQWEWRREDDCFIAESDLLNMRYRDLKKKFPM